ncbi:MAG: hypothetical protein Q7S40_31605 [Opitutaceae bacterium]|nr:hypothetical protein [Opitutaceae bacterium]
MSANKVTFVALALLAVIAAALYDRNRTREIQTTLDLLNKDRESLNRQVKNLARLVSEAQARESTRTSTANTTRESAAAAAAAAAAMPAPVEEPLPTGVTATAPAGWNKNGSKTDAYVVGVDRLNSFGGMPSAYVKSKAATVDGFGGMMQTISSEDFTGKRVRLSGWVKTEDANQGGGHLWLRVDGQQQGVSLQFDNMDNRPVKGTVDWQECSVVLDVPPDSRALAYGFFVSGGGKMWVSGTKIEPVGPEVASTNMIKPRAALPKTPTNLGFDPDRPKG